MLIKKKKNRKPTGWDGKERKEKTAPHTLEKVMSSHVTNLSYSPRLNPAGITSEEHKRRLLKMLSEKMTLKNNLGRSPEAV